MAQSPSSAASVISALLGVLLGQLGLLWGPCKGTSQITRHGPGRSRVCALRHAPRTAFSAPSRFSPSLCRLCILGLVHLRCKPPPTVPQKCHLLPQLLAETKGQSREIRKKCALFGLQSRKHVFSESLSSCPSHTHRDFPFCLMDLNCVMWPSLSCKTFLGK